jgi:putative transposase
MVNDCIKIGLRNNCSTLKKLSQLSYCKLKGYQIHSTYKVNAISQACGRLAQMKRSIKKGIKTKLPYVSKPFLVNCYGFKINGMLLSIPFRPLRPINILLNEYAIKILSDTSLKVRSFSISETSISLCIAKNVVEIKCHDAVGIDRNLRNITIGNAKSVTIYNTAKLVQIKENTTHIVSTFKRNDHKIRNKLYTKFGKRITRRTEQFLHKISKDIVHNAKQSKSMIIFEDLKGIRKLYRKGNGQGHKFRRKLNSWSFYELQKQVEYKAKWEGIPVKFVNPRCTSTLCPRCGNRLQEDRQRRRDLWCGNCKRWQDRDVIASMNIAYKGWLKFIHPQGVTSETNEGELCSCSNQEPIILRVDVAKLGMKSYEPKYPNGTRLKVRNVGNKKN